MLCPQMTFKQHLANTCSFAYHTLSGRLLKMLLSRLKLKLQDSLLPLIQQDCLSNRERKEKNAVRRSDHGVPAPSTRKLLVTLAKHSCQTISTCHVCLQGSRPSCRVSCQPMAALWHQVQQHASYLSAFHCLDNYYLGDEAWCDTTVFVGAKVHV